MALISEVHRQRWDQATTTNQSPGGGLLTSHGGERRGCIGGGGEATRGDSGSGSPSNLPSAVTDSLSVSWFSISAAVHSEIKYTEVYIGVFRSS